MKQRRASPPVAGPQRRASAPAEAPHLRELLRPIPAPQTAIPIDSYADAALVIERDAKGCEVSCDVCGHAIEGEPSGLGLFLSTRGDEVRLEEPALCAACASVIGWSVSLDSRTEEDGG